jgi:hypothetical protein
MSPCYVHSFRDLSSDLPYSPGDSPNTLDWALDMWMFDLDCGLGRKLGYRSGTSSKLMFVLNLKYAISIHTKANNTKQNSLLYRL